MLETMSKPTRYLNIDHQLISMDGWLDEWMDNELMDEQVDGWLDEMDV